MNKFELAQYNHANIQELIRFIDQKSAALLVIVGFILSAFVEFAKDLKFVNPFELSLNQSIYSILTLILGIVFITILLYQIYIVLFEIIRPRKAKNYTQEIMSTMYFEHISNQTKSDFVSAFKKLSDEDTHQELIEQIYECSCILNEKSIRFNEVLNYFYLLVFILLSFIFLSRMI
jgi:Family of unknown function (DUF5706)